MQNQPQHQQLKEGLRPLDLKEMIHPVFEVDTFRSKMGEDQDVCVVSFKVKDRAPAKDLMEFIEKGFYFVLDSDVSSGEDAKGEYSVFVELPRTPQLAEQIKEITYGVRKLTGIEDFKFKYHKSNKMHEVSEETLKSVVPATSKDYSGFMEKMRTEGVKTFFNKTLMDDLTLDGDIITFHKPFNKTVQLRMIKEGETEAILEGSTDPILMDDEAMSEIFWLTKVLGNYNINKMGDSFIFDNNGQSMLLQRI
jgi:hypothetical protein